jgi:hypothetical protein
MISRFNTHIKYRKITFLLFYYLLQIGYYTQAIYRRYFQNYPDRATWRTCCGVCPSASSSSSDDSVALDGGRTYGEVTVRDAGSARTRSASASASATVAIDWHSSNLLSILLLPESRRLCSSTQVEMERGCGKLQWLAALDGDGHRRHL